MQSKLKNQTYTIRPDMEISKIHQSLLQKRFFVDETNQTSRERSYSYKSNLNAKTGSCSEASSSEEEDVGMRKSRRKRYLFIQMKYQMVKVLKRKTLNHLRVVEKVTFKM